MAEADVGQRARAAGWGEIIEAGVTTADEFLAQTIDHIARLLAERDQDRYGAEWLESVEAGCDQVWQSVHFRLLFGAVDYRTPLQGREDGSLPRLWPGDYAGIAARRAATAAMPVKK